ncbi:MAG: MFS transporter [Chloroflexota bacterium]|nr:MFS transporter [Chloroflexota bacterium]
MAAHIADDSSSRAISPDFLRFWIGQTISNVGTAVTYLAIPLLIYERTDSALALSLAAVATILPRILFGLLIGAWVDRVNRKRLMIATDILRFIAIVTIPVLGALDLLPLWWIYVVAFVNAALATAFDSAEFAAIPSLVPKEQLVTANGRIQATYAAATVLGPLLAGALIGVVSVETVLAIDAVSYLLSALSLTLVRRSFNVVSDSAARASIRSDISEGLRYVWRHPVLRAISLMMLVFNFVGATVGTQLVLFSERRLDATEREIGMLYAASGLGVIVLTLCAGQIRKRLSFGHAALGALLAHGLLTTAFALNTNYWLAMAILAVMMGSGLVFNVFTGSLRQSIVPSEMLGRVMSVAMVAAAAASPLGSILGGLAIEWTGDVAAVYTVIGLLMVAIATGFSFSALGHADRYLTNDDSATAPTGTVAGESIA